MADPCPSCSAPLALDGTFCKACGYDLELQVADWQGEGTELPDEDDEDYQRTLEREGLATDSTGNIPWGVLAGLLASVALLLAILLLNAT